MGLQFTQIADLVLSTLSSYSRGDVLNLAQTTQFYASQDFFTKAKQEPGLSLTWFATTTDNGSAAPFGPFGTITPNNTDSDVSFTVPWIGWQFNLAYDTHVIARNSQGDKEMLYNLLKKEYDRAWLSNWGRFEGQVWDRPVDSNNAADNMFGLPYWVTMAGATSTIGLSATELTGFAAGIGGQLASAVPQWGNYQRVHTDMTYADGIDGLRSFVELSNYMAPMNVDYLKTNKPARKKIYTGLANKKAIADVQRSQNQNIGADVAEYDGKEQFKGVPVEYVPRLDNAAYKSALYCIDREQIEYVACKGSYNTQIGPKLLDAQPTTMAAYWINYGNMRALDRRTSFVTATDTFGVTGRIL